MRHSRDGAVDATVHLQVEPDWSNYRDDDGELGVRGARVVRMTQGRPQQPAPGTVLVKLTVRVPRAAFYPLRPEAVVVVPESLTEATPVEVVAEDPAGTEAGQ